MNRMQIAAEVNSGAAHGTGPFHAWVLDAAGRRFATDECNHRLVIQHPGHCEIRIGRRGSGIGEFAYPQGLALLQDASLERSRVFVCDTLNHRVQVFDGRGVPVAAFGQYGSGPGQFAAPADVAIVHPELPGDSPRTAAAHPLLAIADQWNGRVQILETDGTFVASIGTKRRVGQPRGLRSPAAGWPFFRLAPDPVLRMPAHLAWRAPHLDVVCANGHRVRIDLALAMLPPWPEWQATAAAERARALRYFQMVRSRQRALPAEILSALAGAPDVEAA
jgi:hypothetical protein